MAGRLILNEGKLHPRAPAPQWQLDARCWELVTRQWEDRMVGFFQKHLLLLPLLSLWSPSHSEQFRCAD